MRPSLLLPSALLFLSASLPAALPVFDGEGGGLPLSWSAFHDPQSRLLPDPFKPGAGGHASAQAVHAEAELGAGAVYPFAGFNASFDERDLSRWEGVRFWARGSGGWSCALATAATAREHNDYQSPFQVTQDWRLVELPFGAMAQTWGGKAALDLSHSRGLNWIMGGNAGNRGRLSVDDVEFYGRDEARLPKPEANPILAEPKVDQTGYLPGAAKPFAVSVRANGAQPGDAFWVLDAAGTTVLAGSLPSRAVDDQASSGESVLMGDMGALPEGGPYRVKVGAALSPSFRVAPDVFAPLYRDALHCFRVLRCGVALDDPATGLKHAACHTQDAALAGGGRDTVTGGWHNADDYGKWVLEEALSCAWMLWLHELKGPGWSGEGPLLDEARWGLDWMLKMQRPDGSVLHKVDAQDHFCTGTPPEKDPWNGRRLAQPATSIDAGDFCGVMALASRAYATSDPAYARRCRRAAEAAWAWLEAHPAVMDLDPDYEDKDPSQEALWALGEMARIKDDRGLRARFLRLTQGREPRPPTWMDPGLFGWLALMQAPGGEALRERLQAVCKPLVERSRANGYGVLTQPYEYWWESNELLLGRAGALLMAHALGGTQDQLEAGLRQLDWLLGLNSLGFSFVAGHGEHAMSHPWHWAYAAYGVALPGWCAGGPNRHADKVGPLLAALIQRGTPPAKCYVDAAIPGQGSWASNEGETSLNAALVFCAGYLTPDKAPASPPL